MLAQNNSSVFYRFYVLNPSSTYTVVIKTANRYAKTPVILADARNGLCSSPMGILSNWTQSVTELILPPASSTRMVAWCISVKLNFSAFSVLNTTSSISFVFRIFEEDDTSLLKYLETNFAAFPTLSLQGPAAESYLLKEGSFINLKVNFTVSLNGLWPVLWTNEKRKTSGNWFLLLPKVPYQLQVNTSCKFCKIRICVSRRIENVDICQSPLEASDSSSLIRELTSLTGNFTELRVLFRSGPSWPSLYFSIYLSSSVNSSATKDRNGSEDTFLVVLKHPPVQYDLSSSAQHMNVTVASGEAQYWSLMIDHSVKLKGLECVAQVSVIYGVVDFCLSFHEAYPSCIPDHLGIIALSSGKSKEIAVPCSTVDNIFVALVALGSDFIGAHAFLNFNVRNEIAGVTYSQWYSLHMVGEAQVGFSKNLNFALEGFGVSGQTVKLSIERWDQSIQNASGCPVAVAINIDSVPYPSSMVGYTSLLDPLIPVARYKDIFGRAEMQVMSAFTTIPYHGYGRRLIISISNCPIGYIAFGKSCLDINECDTISSYISNDVKTENFCDVPYHCVNLPGSLKPIKK